jgi:ABC-type glutathione transport system ATPase component
VSAADPLLEVEHLKVIFHGDRGRTTHAVDRLDLTIRRGQTLDLVGESGCGKSVTALAIMGLLPKDSAEVEGRIRFDRTDLLTLSDREMRNMRGDRLAMIFQEPMTSLNPMYSIGEQIAETLIRHRILPNILPALLVQATLSLAAAIFAEAALSFLGLGQQPPAPSWGSMLNSAQRFLVNAPWMAVWPGLAIFLAVLSFNLVGDGLRDALDPRSR